MTRQEFIDNVNDIYELREFTLDVELPEELDEVYTYDEVCDMIDDRIVDWARQCSWTELRDMLNDCPTEEDVYYVSDDYNASGFSEYDNYEFEDDKQRILDDIDSYHPEIWDDPEEEDEPEEEFPEEEIDFAGFVTDCSDESVRFISQRSTEDDEDEDEEDSLIFF